MKMIMHCLFPGLTASAAVARCAMMIFVFVLVESTVWLPAEGNIDFENFDSHAIIYDVDGKTPLAGSAFLAELYGAAPGNSLQPIPASITEFSTQPGCFVGPDVFVPGVPRTGRASVQVVAWRASDGPTFAAANHPGAHVGASPVFQMTTGDGLGAPSPSLIGLQSFSLYVVPEPSVFALILVGGIVLIVWPRRQRPAAPSLLPSFASVGNLHCRPDESTEANGESHFSPLSSLSPIEIPIHRSNKRRMPEANQ